MEDSANNQNEKDQFMNGLSSNIKNILMLIGGSVFTVNVIYLLYVSALTYEVEFSKNLDIVYLSSKIDLLDFYANNVTLTSNIVASILILISVYIFCWIGLFFHTKIKTIYIAGISAVYFSPTILRHNFLIGKYVIDVLILTTIIYFSIRFMVPYIKKVLNRVDINKNYKALKYMLVFSAFSLLFVLLTMNALAVSIYWAKDSAKNAAQYYINYMDNDLYRYTGNHIFLTDSKEEGYLLKCQDSDCMGLKKNNLGRIVLILFDKKDFKFFYEIN